MLTAPTCRSSMPMAPALTVRWPSGAAAASDNAYADTRVIVLENGALATGYQSAGTWYIQRWSETGTAQGAPVAVSDSTVVATSDLQLTAVGDDILATFVAPDADGNGVYSRLFSSSGVPLTDALLINDTTTGNQSAHRWLSWRMAR